MFDALTGTHRYGVCAALCWTEAELEEIRAYDASVDDEDKARLSRRETDRRYYEKHKEKINAYSRQYAKANPEKFRAYRRAYYQRRKEQERILLVLRRRQTQLLPQQLQRTRGVVVWTGKPI